MVGSTEAVGGVLRCVTLAVKDDLALEKWIQCLQKVLFLVLLYVYCPTTCSMSLNVDHL